MDQERAEQIVADCIRFEMFAMGIGGEGAKPPDLDYSLAELLEANHCLKKSIKNPNGTTTIHMTCDDRLIAALYVLKHYEASAPDSVEPIVHDGEKAVAVISIRSFGDE